MLYKHILSWFGLLVIAVINGALREATYKPLVGDLAAHQLSTLSGIILFGIFIWYINKRWQLESAKQAWAVGLIWLAMTICFEFLFFHYIGGKPWEVLLHDYNIFEGRIWVLVLMWVAVAPRIIWSWGKSKKIATDK